MRILLIEDNPGDIRLLQEYLKEGTACRFQITQAGRLSTGLECLAEARFDAVLLDLSLPDSQGLDTLVRLHAAAKDVPIVVLTGIEDEALGVRLIQAGGQDYLVKGYVTGPLLVRSLRYAVERKQAQEALSESEAQLRAILDNSPGMVFLKDTEGRYLHVNREFERAFHMTREQVVGKTDEAIFVPEQAAAFRANDRKVLQAGSPLEFEEVVLHEDGPHTSIAFKFPLFGGDGKPYALCGITTDITERKVMEAALQQREAQLESLSAQLLQAQEEERRRIAQELHDDFTQRLAALAIDLRTVQLEPSDSAPWKDSRLQQLGDSAEQLAVDLQQISHRLHPSILEDVGLEAAVKEHADEFSARTGLPTEVLVREVPKDVPLEQALCLYRVLQESLQNVRKHAHATTVLVRLLRTGGGLGLCVLDDGRGFENAQGAEGRRGLGLTSMEERVKRFHGTFRIKTKPGDGTEVHAWVPLDEGKSDG
jgi:PAS domain S-box-containing protein